MFCGSYEGALNRLNSKVTRRCYFIEQCNEFGYSENSSIIAYNLKIDNIFFHFKAFVDNVTHQHDMAVIESGPQNKYDRSFSLCAKLFRFFVGYFFVGSARFIFHSRCFCTRPRVRSTVKYYLFFRFWGPLCSVVCFKASHKRVVFAAYRLMCPACLSRREGAVDEYRDELISITGYRHTHAAQKMFVQARTRTLPPRLEGKTQAGRLEQDQVREIMKMPLALLLHKIEFTSSVMAAGGGGGDDGSKTNFPIARQVQTYKIAIDTKLALERNQSATSKRWWG